MKRTINRLVVVTGISAGLLVAMETAANAGVLLGNHSEPTARDRR
jgi:hypothetical protein